MIFIQFYKTNNFLSKVIISGHSGKKGSSIPCAAISYLVQSISSYSAAKGIAIAKDDGKVYNIDLVKLKKFSDDMYEFLIFSLELIARDYSKDIKLEFLEENNGT